MSDTSVIVLPLALLGTVLGLTAYAGLRLLHARKYRAAKVRLSAARASFAQEKALKRLKLLSILDNMVERCDRMIVALSGSERQPRPLALAAGKRNKRHKKKASRA